MFSLSIRISRVTLPVYFFQLSKKIDFVMNSLYLLSKILLFWADGKSKAQFSELFSTFRLASFCGFTQHTNNSKTILSLTFSFVQLVWYAYFCISLSLIMSYFSHFICCLQGPLYQFRFVPGIVFYTAKWHFSCFNL